METTMIRLVATVVVSTALVADRSTVQIARTSPPAGERFPRSTCEPCSLFVAIVVWSLFALWFCVVLGHELVCRVAKSRILRPSDRVVENNLDTIFMFSSYGAHGIFAFRAHARDIMKPGVFALRFP